MAGSLGAKSSIGFKHQAVAGTAETTVALHFPAEKFQMGLNPEFIDRKAAMQAEVAMPHSLGIQVPGGSLPGAPFHASRAHVLYWLLGNTAVVQPDVTTAPTVYRHTVTVPSNLAVPILTVEGDKVDTQKKQADAKLDKLELACKYGEEVAMSMEWLGLTHTDGATLTSNVTYPTDDPLTFAGAAVSIAGSSDLTVDEANLTIENGLEAKGAFNALRTPAQIRRAGGDDGAIKISGKLGFIDYSSANYTKLIAATSFALILTFTGAVISGAYSNYVKITLPVCRWKSGLNPEIGAEVITDEADFTAYYDTATSKAITCEVQNTVASLS